MWCMLLAYSSGCRCRQFFDSCKVSDCFLNTSFFLLFLYLDMSHNTSPTGPLRKHLSTGTAGLGGNSDRGRSLSPIPMAVPVKGKSTAVPASGSAIGSKMLGKARLVHFSRV